LSFGGLATNQIIVVNAETINSNSQTRTINFNVENSGNSDCYYFITINEGVTGDINYNRQAQITHALPAIFQQADQDTISYQLYSQSVTASNIVKTLNHAVFSQNVLGPFHIRAGQSLSESFLIHIPTQTLPNLIAESYEDDVRLTLYQSPNALIDFVNDCPTCTEESQHPLNIQFEVMDYVTLSIGDSYNPSMRQALLDFGELQSNKQQSFEVYVGGRSGSGSTCAITIRSENGSKLLREDVVGSLQDNYEVGYLVHAQGDMGSPTIASNIDLSNPNIPVKLATSSVPFLCGNNSKGVMIVKVYITIGDIEKKLSGVYRDTLTVEVTIGL